MKHFHICGVVPFEDNSASVHGAYRDIAYHNEKSNPGTISTKGLETFRINAKVEPVLPAFNRPAFYFDTLLLFPLICDLSGVC